MSHFSSPPSHRRGFLRRTLGGCWTGAALLEQSVFRAAQARAQANPGLPSLFDIKKVADGIYAAIGRPTTLINSNAAIFEMTDGLLVVDSHSKPSAVYSLAAQIKREVSPKPVKYLVNSHFHWDHSQGNAAFKKVHPQATIVSSAGTRQLLSEQAMLRLKGSLDETSATIEQMKDKLGKSSNAEDKKFYQAQIKEAQSYLAEMKSYTPEIPAITVGRDLVLHDKMHDLHLAFRGRAHTAGDISVFCPQKKVIATGDMLHGFQPWLNDAYPYEWPKTLYTFAELDFTQVIGGHADVQQGKGRLYNMAGFIEELLERTTRSRFESKEQLKRDLKPAALKSLARDGYGDFIASNLRKYTPVLPSERNVDNLPGLVETCIDQMLFAVKRDS
jgi:cyclase